ncbi:MAG: hypothetical protein IT233_08300 [Bacteroidia bacterium]|nr:hypothetical protein [Bacteroidia bacterium]
MKKAAILVLTLSISTFTYSQENTPAPNNSGEIRGSFESTGQYYNPDSAIGAPEVPEKWLFNGYCNLTYTRGHFNAGVRYESYLNVLQGYDPGYKGTGIAIRYASYKVDDLEVTVGNFYEQFGNGLSLRIYEERGLGIDNSLDGVRVIFKPVKGVYLKGLIGRQRKFFNYSGLVRGLDGELNLNEFVKKWEEKKTKVILGGSFVSKFQADGNPNLILPQNVGLSAGRFIISHGNFKINAEYAYKINDPSNDNGYIYNHGEGAIVQASYSKKGIGFLVGVKRIDNMSYKSDRDANGNFSTINFNPALVRQHTYGLMAFHPYASQNNGELGYQAEFMYKFKKETKLGGKYGMDLAINYSASHALDTTQLNDTISLIGYEAGYFPPGDNIYFQDLNIEITKKFTKKVKGTFLYSYQQYDIAVIQGKPGHGDFFSHIFVADLTFRVSDENALRIEAQHLSKKQEDMSWVQGLAEFTLGERFFFAATDQYNYNNPVKDTTGAYTNRIHYFNGSVGYVKNATRMTLGYGKQRAGIFCVGGVCRYVPASNGFTFQISTSF